TCTSTSDMGARAYALSWLLLLMLPGCAWYLASTGPVRAIAFRAAMPEGSYLLSLRDSTLACESLGLRKPQAAVIGDSHSYAGWDFAALQAGLGERLGGCALGGLYIETVPLLLGHVLHASPGLRTVVLGLSPRMFWESPSKQEQINAHRRLIPAMK